MENIERKIIFGTVIALTIAVAVLAGSVMAVEDTSGTILTDDIAPYTGPIGADSPLYGLKLALEDMDESFTADETERVDKQMDHARIRLSEVRRSLEMNQDDSAEEALNNYWLKMDLTNMTLAKWSSDATGLLHAQEMIVKHQLVLENLLASNPDNKGLQRAYDNSLRLEEKIGEKTAIKYDRTMNKNNQTILKAIRLVQKEYTRNGWPDTTTTQNPAVTDDKQKGWEKDKDRDSGNVGTVTTVATQVPTTEKQQNQDNQQVSKGNSGGNSQQNSNANDKVKTNSRSK